MATARRPILTAHRRPMSFASSPAELEPAEPTFTAPLGPTAAEIAQFEREQALRSCEDCGLRFARTDLYERHGGLFCAECACPLSCCGGLEHESDCHVRIAQSDDYEDRTERD